MNTFTLLVHKLWKVQWAEDIDKLGNEFIQQCRDFKRDGRQTGISSKEMSFLQYDTRDHAEAITVVNTGIV